MGQPTQEASATEWAEYYLSHGLAIVPAKGKRPKLDWKQYQDATPSADRVRGWFDEAEFTHKGLQIYVICGTVSQVVVLDCDSEAAIAWWGSLLGVDVLEATARVRTGSGRGFHYWFRLGDRPQKSRAAHHGDMKWDLRGDGGGVIIPPSWHDEVEGQYEWEIPLEAIQDWPYPDIPNLAKSADGSTAVVSGGEIRTGLAQLLATPGEGGRNNWVTKVLGHYARVLKFEDGYRATAEMVWQMASTLPSDHPYDRAEFDRTVDSVWRSEKVNWGEAGRPDQDNGWLVGNGRNLLTSCQFGEQPPALRPWSNFDLVAKSAVIEADGFTSYVLDITIDHGNTTSTLEEVVLPGERLGSTDQLSKWLAAKRMVIHRPKGDVGQLAKMGSRLQLYIEAQDPPRRVAVPWMGWNETESGEEVYVCEQGVITADGMKPLERAGMIPNPRHSDRDKDVGWFYGFEATADVAAATLQEVLTFHDPLVTSLFGALWALAPIKGAVMKAASLFPHLAVIAPSEAGKTNGYFDLMLQANGRMSVGGTYTPASLRDDLSRHRGGFVWIDDPANVDDLGDLLRGAAGESVHTRKGGANWSETVRTHLVAPIVISAEGLDMLNERAMADRVIEFEVPKPTGRISRYGEYPQWDDVVRLMTDVGHLSQFGGWYVQRSWEWLRSIGGTAGLRSMMLELRVGSGRLAEKLAVARAGARCLQYIATTTWPEGTEYNGYLLGSTEPVEIVALVDAWAIGQTSGEEAERAGPYLIEVVVPAFLAARGFIPRYNSVPSDPVFLDNGGVLRVNIPGLAQWWAGVAARRPDRTRASQLGSLSAMTSESKLLDLSTSVPIKGRRYAGFTEQVARKILSTAGYDFDAAVAEHST